MSTEADFRTEIASHGMRELADDYEAGHLKQLMKPLRRQNTTQEK